jgi:succinyl-CoA synthetase beta subunit
MGKEAFNGKEA